MRRRRVIVATLMVGAVAAAVPLAMARLDSKASASDEPSGASDATATAAAPTTAEVTRRDLTERTELSGTLGYGDATELSLQRQGTLTALPAGGSIVERGQAIAEVDGRAVPLFYGDRPMWRPLGAGVEDGADIKSLEENLIALGYATARTLTADNAWTAATDIAVKKWQKARGVTETGTVDVGTVVYHSGPVRIASRMGTTGGNAGGPIVSVTGTERAVSIDLDADEQDSLAEGQKVAVELPDGSSVPATVRSKGSVVHAPSAQGGGSATIDVVVALDDPAAAGALDEAPVTVVLTETKAAGALAVPVGALLALAEGGYAVEQVDAAGVRALVAVELGAFAEGWVEITGDLAEGDAVVVPS